MYETGCCEKEMQGLLPTVINSITMSKKARAGEFERRYRLLRRRIKHQIFINAAICDEVLHTEENLARSKAERQFLVRKLIQFETSTGETPKAVSLPTNTVKSAPVRSKAQDTHAATRRDAVELISPIPLDEFGRPDLPVQLGSLTVHCLGEVITERAAFHTPEVFYPAGFCSTRLYASTTHPRAKCLYTCQVLDNEGPTPQFVISSDETDGIQLKGTSISECHSRLLSAVNKVCRAEVVSTAGRGAEFFGLRHPVVQHLVQASAGPKRCPPDYRWRKFQVAKDPSLVVTPHENDPDITYDAFLRHSRRKRQDDDSEMSDEDEESTRSTSGGYTPGDPSYSTPEMSARGTAYTAHEALDSASNLRSLLTSEEHQ